MASIMINLNNPPDNEPVNKLKGKKPGEQIMSKENIAKDKKSKVKKPKENDLMDLSDLDFVDHYAEDKVYDDSMRLPENTITSAISCGFIGLGGGGGKLAKSFLDLGYNKTLLINTTAKDQPENVDQDHFLLLAGCDGVGKDVKVGEDVLADNSALVEDALQSRLGKLDWLFVCASGGGGTGSSAAILDDTFNRYLSANHASGRVVYVITSPTSQEMLNPTIKSNYEHLLSKVSKSTYILIDNERQLELLRGKVGMLEMYPKANQAFSRMLAQVFKMATESSPIQSFDTQDLERCLAQEGRIFLGTVAIKDFKDKKLGLKIYQGCLERSPCPVPSGKPAAGSLILIVDSSTASDPVASNQMESAISYVGGRSKTQFSGVYVREGLQGLVAICMLSGM